MDPEIQSQDLNPGTLLLDPATLLFSSKGHPSTDAQSSVQAILEGPALLGCLVWGLSCFSYHSG